MASTLLHPGRRIVFIDAGGWGHRFGLAEDITNAVINEEPIVDRRIYHTIYERLKMVAGAHPSKLHMAGYTMPMALQHCRDCVTPSMYI